MEPIIIDGLSEEQFRRSIEDMLRYGDADGAAERLRRLITPFAGQAGPLPARFLTVAPGEIRIGGWGDLPDQVDKYDRPDHPVSAISIAVCEPEKRAARSGGTDWLSPCVETSFFSDEAYPFADADRADLLDGYSSFGCEWAGDTEGQERTLTIDGVEDLFGAIASLETRLLDSEEPDGQAIAAGSIGSCYLAVMVHQAVCETIRNCSLPRPLSVMAGSNGVYPFFDAPVMTCDEYLAKGAIIKVPRKAVEAPTQPDAVAANPGEEEEFDQGSLLNVGVRKMKKQPVLLLEMAELEASYDDMARAQFAALGGGGYISPPPVDYNAAANEDEPEPWESTAPDIFADPGSFVEANAMDADEPDEGPEFSWTTSSFAAEPLDHDPAWDAPDAGEPAATEPPVSEPDLDDLAAPEEPSEPLFDLREPETASAGYHAVFPDPGPAPLKQTRVPVGLDGWQGSHFASYAESIAEGAEYAGFNPYEYEPTVRPALAPGQEPASRGHSLRKSLPVVEEADADAGRSGRSLLGRLMAWLVGR
ncbi:MAG: hypothetical protein ABIU18_08880 [Novosphingobium sp.]